MRMVSAGSTPASISATTFTAAPAKLAAATTEAIGTAASWAMRARAHPSFASTFKMRETRCNAWTTCPIE
jgi:hypothetical protein